MPVKLRFSPTPPASRSAASAPTPARESAPGVGTAPGIGTAAGPDTPPHPGDDTLELIADYRLPPRARSVPSPTGPDSSSTPTRTADPETVTLNLEDDDLLEIELDDGLILWTTAEDFRDDADSLGISTDPDAPLDLEAPFASLDTAPSRGVRRAIARGLRIFRRRNTPVGDNIVEVVTALESRRPLGLYPVGGPQGLRALNPAERITAPLAKSDEPILILIHGTASSYEGSFGDLINSGHTGTAADSTAAAASTTPSDITDPVRPGAATNPTRLIDRYGQRIYAFEHRTLAQSPIDNAIELLELLPKNQPVAFLTHSRGGLVGELLCMHAAPDMKRLQAYRRDSVWLAETGLNDSAELRRTLTEADTRDRERLVQLAAALKTRRPKVVSFARVACPAQGTTLASRRLDRFLSILGNLIGLLPPLRASLLYAWFRNLARDVISRRVRPDQLPGLEAMLPYSPLVAFLNADDGAQIDGELGVIAGDIEGGRLLQRFGLLILDRLYRGDHDLVVDTASMAGGLARSGGTWRCFDQGDRVSHFRYFANPGTRDALLAWLLRAADAEMPSAFARIGHAEGPALSGIQPAARPEVDTPSDTRNASGALVTRTTLDTPSTRASRGETIHTPRPTLFLLPGTMGSHLKMRRSRIWLTPGRILRGRLKDLAVDGPDVSPDGAFRRYYGALAEHLAHSHEVHVFDYDWRLSIDESATRLAADIAAVLAATDTPVRLLAHSMGGLVVRALAHAAPDVWRELRAREGARAVLLGTPNHGSHAIVESLLGHATQIKQLALLDTRHSLNALLALISRLPGLLDLLPEDDAYDFWQSATWRHLIEHNRGFGTAPHAATLKAAKRRREALGETVADAELFTYVAGVADHTPSGVEITTRGQLGERVHFIGTEAGDGRVTWASGALEGVPMRYAEVAHGDLSRAAQHFEAYRQLLDGIRAPRGLSEHPPGRLRGADSAAHFGYAPRAALYPDADSLMDNLMGAQGGAIAASIQRVTQLRVTVHGEDLAGACCPVVVAHAAGSAIAGAEAALDEQLNGALTARQRLGRYPARLGSVATFWPFNASGQPTERAGLGGIVVGLGPLGDITLSTLQEAARIAALEYVLALPIEQHPPTGTRLATVLFGVNSPDGMHPGAVMEAIVRGTIEANRELRERSKRALQIDELAFFEHDTQRLQAAHAAFSMRREAVAGELEAEIELGELPAVPAPTQAAIPVITSGAERAPRWHQLCVTTADGNPNVLRYELLTRRARLEVREHPIDAAMIRNLVAEAISDTRANPMLANTLHHLLIPKRLEDALEHLGPVVLLVDEDTAWIPFELLHSNRAPNRAPHAVRHGMLRQFRTHLFDESPTMASGRNALVIGDPRSDYPPLPGAAKEARRVRAMLMQHGFEVAGNEPDSTPTDILNLLFDRPWRILHVAAHGVYRETGEGGAAAGESGIVIGPGQLLTGVQIRAMREVPEFVFLNCCHLGKMGVRGAEVRRGMPMFAGNVARQFIRAGVKGVVVAGWEIADDVAVVYAEGVYRELMGGAGFGESVRAATIEMRREFGKEGGFGAWHTYGDAGLKLL